MNYKYLILAAIVAAVLLCQPAPGLASILGSAESFGVLGGSMVTNTGSTTILGNLGVSPTPAVTGFPPGLVSGTIYGGGAVAAQAQSDLTKAYNGLAAMPYTTDLSGHILGSAGYDTLTSGVYKFTSSAQLTGTLTLNAQGNNNAYWVFQIGSTLDTASGSVVQVINGGMGNGVFWQVGSSATIGTGTAFEGNILADQSITLGTGATILNGRALARIAAVTLDTNDIRTVCPNGGPGYSGGLGYDTYGAVVPIPEPATLALLALGGIGLLARRRRK